MTGSEGDGGGASPGGRCEDSDRDSDQEISPRALPRRGLMRRDSVRLRSNIKMELEEMQRHLSLSSDNSAADATKETPWRKECTELQLQELRQSIAFYEETIQHLQKELFEKESKNESAGEELREWKHKYEKMKRLNFELMKKMANKAKEQIRSHAAMTKAEVEDWKGKYAQMGELYDALVDKVTCLSDENEDWKGKYAQMGELYDALVDKVTCLSDENAELVTRCRRSEAEGERQREELAQLDEVREECDVLHRSMEEAMAMATGMSDRVAQIDQDHREEKDELTERIADLNQKLVKSAFTQKQSDEALAALREENDILTKQFKNAEKFYKESLEKKKKTKSKTKEEKKQSSRRKTEDKRDAKIALSRKCHSTMEMDGNERASVC
eukprot:CAMPEP_0172574854 /NCGR_PEP_ID=MMETSP1067-20121228/136913_1 /TAXON_ID=265564 ORGANISM="Thalassiosira punctigera, Strain Tpunct2005C2" /NCGR_SAMPLE_ID=MMETSP1067 /ASSEMBLY_ACC=CAM_ASM_000444 /LENGTH=385 /DNA_ID=CAMNT_0013367489 /DNA_START=213 /DNA_END=1371 /DNA_ORIENTATION=-